MRLKVTQHATNQHQDIVTSVGWTAANELFTCSDDKTIFRWNMNGDPQGKVLSQDAYFTDIHWFPNNHKRGQNSAQNDFFVVACTDGTFRLISKAGRVEKSVEAHRGACIALHWSYDGTALVTAGEDGIVKVWSRSGMLRSTLAQLDRAVYSVTWGPDSDQVLFTYGKELIIKPLQPSSKQLQWKAHDGIVLKVDWNPINNLIVSGGEDCKYKVWDCYGRNLYSSPAVEYSVTSVAWCPNGEHLAIGYFNTIKLCDKTGWPYSKVNLSSGSILCLSWTSDGTQLAGGGGNGSVCFGQLVDRVCEWNSTEVKLCENNRIRVTDVLQESSDELTDFRDRVITMSLGFGHLIVTTSTQCCLYLMSNVNTPHIFDIKDTVNMIVQCEKYFLMVDNINGLQVYTYEGRLVSSPKYQGLRPEFLNRESVSLSNDTVAVVDRSEPKTIRLFDVSSGKATGDPIKHSMDISELSLNHYGPISDRKMVIIDRNRDLYIYPVGSHVAGKTAAMYKLGTMCDSAMWNDETDMLGALMDSKFVVWFYPNVVFVDRDLTTLTRSIKDASEFGKNPKLQGFYGTYVSVRRSDGAQIASSVPPFPTSLYEATGKGDWDRGIQLCRFVKDPAMWGCLAAMAMNSMELNTAEVAYAAIDEVDKLQLILYIKGIPTVEARNAEMALFKRRPHDAEAILLQAGLYYRAIKMNIRLFNWDRALELAVQHQTHVDTVLAYRKKYLDHYQVTEDNKRYIQYSEGVTIDWAKIVAKKKQEKEKEKARPGAKPYE